jgi:hypothetical protein
MRDINCCRESNNWRDCPVHKVNNGAEPGQMVFMVPFRFTKTKGARFKLVVGMEEGFQYRIVHAKSVAEAIRKLEEKLRPLDSRGIGGAKWVGHYRIENVRQRVISDIRLEREKRGQIQDPVWPDQSPEQAFENLLKTVENRGVIL